MATLSPILNGGVTYEQPVATPSLIGEVGGLARAFASALPTPKGPSESDKKGAALQPFAAQVADIWNSDLSDAKKTRLTRKAQREQYIRTPQYNSDIDSIVSGYGVQDEVLPVTPEDSMNAALNEYYKTPEGQADSIRALTYDKDGNFDEEATHSKMVQYAQESFAEKAELERSNRALSLVQNDVAKWKAQSELQMGSFLPKWTSKSQGIVDSLMRSAAAGSVEVDTPEEQLAYITQARQAMVNEYTAKAQAAGIHPEVYKAQIDQAVAPLNTFIETAKQMGDNAKVVLDGFRNVAQLGMEKVFYEALGPISQNPEFMKTYFNRLPTTAFDAEVFGKLTAGMAEASKTGQINGFTIMPNLPANPSDAAKAGADGTSAVDPSVVDDMSKKAADDSKYLDTRLMSSITLIETIQEVDSPKARGEVFRDFSTIVAVSEAAKAPLGNGFLTQIFSPKNVRTYATMAASKDQAGVDLKSSLSYFAAKQITRNKAILNKALENSQGYTVETGSNGTLRIMLNGADVTSVSNTRGLGEKADMIYKSVQAINTINSAMSRIAGEDEELKKTLGSYSFDKKGVETFVDQGTPEVKGGQGGDTIGTALGIDFNAYEEAAGLPGGFLERTAYLESTGNPSAQNTESSATGLFQQTDANAKEWGVKDRFDPVQSTEGAVRFAVSNQKILRSKLGREPTGAELYLAHQQGPGGAVKLLTNQDALAVDIVGEKAVLANGGSLDMKAGEFANIWISKFNGQRGASSYTQATGQPNSAKRPVERPQIDVEGALAGSKASGGGTSQMGATRPQERPESLSVDSKSAGTKSEAATQRAKAQFESLSEETRTVISRILGSEDEVIRMLAEKEVDINDLRAR